MKSLYVYLLWFIFIDVVLSAEISNPEINDQFENVTPASSNYSSTTIKVYTSDNNDENNEIFDEGYDITTSEPQIDAEGVRQNIIATVYKIIKVSIIKFIRSPKINTVMKNIGTCMVNGAMEVVSYYLPAPFIPIIASVAGMVIPFEPVVMLRRRMPVTSYRRAFKTALNGFLNTFDAYKFDNYDEDPYMTRRFNRRFMNEVSKENTSKQG